MIRARIQVGFQSRAWSSARLVLELGLGLCLG